MLLQATFNSRRIFACKIETSIGVPICAFCVDNHKDSKYSSCIIERRKNKRFKTVHTNKTSRIEKLQRSCRFKALSTRARTRKPAPRAQEHHAEQAEEHREALRPASPWLPLPLGDAHRQGHRGDSAQRQALVRAAGQFAHPTPRRSSPQRRRARPCTLTARHA